MPLLTTVSNFHGRRFTEIVAGTIDRESEGLERGAGGAKCRSTKGNLREAVKVRGPRQLLNFIVEIYAFCSLWKRKSPEGFPGTISGKRPNAKGWLRYTNCFGEEILPTNSTL